MLKDRIQAVIDGRLAKESKKSEPNPTKLLNLERFIRTRLADLDSMILKEAKHFETYHDEVIVCDLSRSPIFKGWTKNELKKVDQILGKIKQDPVFAEFEIWAQPETYQTHWDGSCESYLYLKAKAKALNSIESSYDDGDDDDS